MVSDACHTSRDHTHNAVLVLDVIQETGNPVQFVKTQAEGVPMFGVVRVGEVRVLFVRVWVLSNDTTVFVTVQFQYTNSLLVVLNAILPFVVTVGSAARSIMTVQITHVSLNVYVEF